MVRQPHSKRLLQSKALSNDQVQAEFCGPLLLHAGTGEKHDPAADHERKNHHGPDYYSGSICPDCMDQRVSSALESAIHSRQSDQTDLQRHRYSNAVRKATY